MPNDNDGPMSAIEAAIICLDEETISDTLVVSGPGYEDFPCSEMIDLHVELADPETGGPLVPGPISVGVRIEWNWSDATDDKGFVLPGTLTGVVADGRLKVNLIELDLTPFPLPLAA